MGLNVSSESSSPVHSTSPLELQLYPWRAKHFIMDNGGRANLATLLFRLFIGGKWPNGKRILKIK